MTSFESASEDIAEENYRRFKSYRELTESDMKTKYVGKRFCDRYKYFKNFYPELKRAALTVLHSPTDGYLSEKDKVLHLLNALKLKHRESTMQMLNNQVKIIFEVVCEIDCVFIAKKEELYSRILEYFQGMLL